MPASKPLPSDLQYRDAIHAIRVAALQVKFVSDRLAWHATGNVLDADTAIILARDALVNRGGA